MLLAFGLKRYIVRIICSITIRIKLLLQWLQLNDGVESILQSTISMCLDVFLKITFLMIVERIWMQRVMIASWWDTLKSRNPIECFIISNKKSLLGILYGFMRSILESICCMPTLDFYRMIPLMSFLNLVLLLLFQAFD